MQEFSLRCLRWAINCLGIEMASHLAERNNRFLEEAVELVQSLHMPKEEVLGIVDYVYSRDRGRPSQEVGGVMVTLGVLCEANGISLEQAAETELARCIEKSDAIRQKAWSKELIAADLKPLRGRYVR